MSARILKGQKIGPQITYRSLGHFFFECCTKYKKRICQIDGTANQKETYESVRIRSVRFGLELQKHGIRSNDVIVVCCENTLDNVIPIIGAQFLGTKVANLDPKLSAAHIIHLLKLVTPKIILVQKSYLKLIEDCVENAKLHLEIVVFGASKQYRTFSDFVKPQSGEDDFVPAEIDPEDGALMFFSSGTTGLPKAICHSHRSYLEMITQACYCGWGENTLHFTTFYWMTAMMILVGTCHMGNYRVFCRNPTPEDIFRMIQTYKVRCMFMAPNLTYQLTRFENPKKYDTTSLQIMSCGGNPMSDTQIDKLSDIFPNAHTSLLFGMTEIGLITAFEPVLHKELAKKKPSSSGRPVPNIRLKVVDPFTGEMLGPYRKGEICVSSLSLMNGYYKMDSDHVFDKDGFLRTGDEGYYDEEDCVYIVERIKEMFKYKSWHVIPSVVEGVILENPSVKEVAVFGIPDEEDGEIPAACVVLKDGCELDEDVIDDFLKEKVSDTERLRGGITFVKNLPRTPTGKVVRRQVRDFVMGLKK